MSIRTANSDATTRPAFRDGARLRASDLERDAEVNVQAVSQHQTTAHNAGIVAGLKLDWSQLSVTPGMAIDGMGQSIFVPVETLFSAELPELATQAWELWIAYREVPTRDRITSEAE